MACMSYFWRKISCFKHQRSIVVTLIILASVASASFGIQQLLFFYSDTSPASRVPGRETDEPARSNSWCGQTTRAGLCIQDVLDLYDDAYSPLWPARVDLLIRTCFSDRFFLLGPMLHSVRMFWPRGIGQVVLVLDEQDEGSVGSLVPPWVTVKYEKNYLNLPGKYLQQWSYGWADNYTTAPYIAIIDDDVVLNLKVTPPLLFNLTDRLPYVIGNQMQDILWRNNTDWFLGNGSYVANFMVMMPFLKPRQLLPAYREHVGSIHKDKGGTYDAFFGWWAVAEPTRFSNQLEHSLFGNYMYMHARDKAHFALEWTDHPPIPRTSVHLSYSDAFVKLGGKEKLGYLSREYLQVAAMHVHDALCFSFPPGEMGSTCNGVKEMAPVTNSSRLSDESLERQRQVWWYVYRWELWNRIKKRKPGATQVYDQHIAELWCIYRHAVSWLVQQQAEGLQGPKRQQRKLQEGEKQKTEATDGQLRISGEDKKIEKGNNEQQQAQQEAGKVETKLDRETARVAHESRVETTSENEVPRMASLLRSMPSHVVADIRSACIGP